MRSVFFTLDPVPSFLNHVDGLYVREWRCARTSLVPVVPSGQTPFSITRTAEPLIIVLLRDLAFSDGFYELLDTGLPGFPGLPPGVGYLSCELRATSPPSPSVFLRHLSYELRATSHESRTSGSLRPAYCSLCELRALRPPPSSSVFLRPLFKPSSTVPDRP